MTFAATSADRRPPKLPFWSTVGRAFAVPFTSFGSLVSAAWLWVLLLSPVLFVLYWFQVPLQAEDLATMATAPGARPQNTWQLLLLTGLQELVTAPAMASVAVAWHRLIITGEHPTTTYFRLDRSVWLYTGFLLAWMLFFTALGVLPELVASAPVAQATAGIFMLVTLIAATLIMGRLSLVLPAIALGRTDIGLGEAWRTTRGNSWRLFWGPLVCVLVVVIPGTLILLGMAQSERAIAAAAMTAFGLFALLGGVIAVGFLSFAYQHFFQGER